MEGFNAQENGEQEKKLSYAVQKCFCLYFKATEKFTTYNPA